MWLQPPFLWICAPQLHSFEFSFIHFSEAVSWRSQPLLDFSLTVFQTEGSSGKKGSNDVQPGSGNSASPGAQIFLIPFSSSPLANTAWYPHHSQLEWPEAKSYPVIYSVFEPRMPKVWEWGTQIRPNMHSPWEWRTFIDPNSSKFSIQLQIQFDIQNSVQIQIWSIFGELQQDQYTTYTNANTDTAIFDPYLIHMQLPIQIQMQDTDTNMDPDLMYIWCIFDSYLIQVQMQIDNRHRYRHCITDSAADSAADTVR